MKEGMVFFVCVCPGFDWNTLNFLTISWYSATFCIWDENNVDNAMML